MLTEPNCYKRDCVRFQGVRQDEEREETERSVCKAFPDGIPEVIAYGNNLHLKLFPGDGGVLFEKAKT